MDHLARILDSLEVRPRLVLVVPPLPPETIEALGARRRDIRAFVVEPVLAPVWETSVLASTARLLREQGFEVALVPASDSLDGYEGLPLRLAVLVRGGLDPADALAAVTTVPARLLGLEGKVGELRPGAMASFNAYDTDPLASTARLLRVFIEGTEVFRDDPATGKISGEAVR